MSAVLHHFINVHTMNIKSHFNIFFFIKSPMIECKTYGFIHFYQINVWIQFLCNIYKAVQKGVAIKNVYLFSTQRSNQRSSLIYNTRAGHDHHECNTSDRNATRVRHEQCECDTSAKRKLIELHECNTSEKFWFW